jgi:hypothetical protein
MSLFSRGADTFYAFRFLRLLTTDWVDTGAFKAGLIDKDGKPLKKADTSDERSVYNIFHRLVFNIKRLINKVPFGKTTVASYLTALYLIKEHTGMTDEEIQSALSEVTKVEFPALSESVQTELTSGTYAMTRSTLHPMTALPLIQKGSAVFVEEDTKPCGYIFGQPIFEVLHLDTNTKIKVSESDISQ